MIKVLTKYDDIDINQWNDLLYNRSSVPSFFQSPEAFDFHSQFDWLDTLVFAVEEQGKLAGVAVVTIHHEGKGIMRRLTARAIINGGPLLTDNISSECVAALLLAIKSQLRHKCVYIETRNYNDYSQWRDVFETCGFEYKPHYNFHIDTSQPKAAWEKFQKSRRRTIRRATEAGAYITECRRENNEEITNFYSILSNLYKTKIRKPLPPIGFFVELAGQPYGKIFLIHEPDGKIIGGQVCVILKNKVIYAWYCCGLDHDYTYYHPSVLANYAGIKYAVENGIPLMDMMGAGSPGDNGYGVREFKAQFGGQLVEHGRFLHLCNPLVYHLGKWAITLKEKL